MTSRAAPLARAAGLEVRTTRDRDLLAGFLSRDRLLAAYAICDLDPRELPRTRWGVALAGGAPVAVVLEYQGPSPQPIYAAGDPVGVRAILERTIGPRIAWFSAHAELLPAIAERYRIDPGPEMIRMVVDRRSFRPGPVGAVRLSVSDVGELNRLYGLGFAGALPAAAIAEGVYYGVRRGNRIIAAAGTHVIGREMGLAAVGNVLTAEGERGRGYARATTGAVTAELLVTIPEVVLNVRADNPPAIAVYTALGYREVGRFEERLARRRGTLWDSITGPIRRIADRRSV